MAPARFGLSAPGWSQAGLLCAWHHPRFAVRRCSLIDRILEDVPYGLPRPDALTLCGQPTFFLQAAAYFAESTAFPSNPGKNVLHDVRLIWNKFEPGSTFALVNCDVAIAVRRVRHNVQ